MISLEKAIELSVSNIRETGICKVSITEALNRIIAENIYSPHDIPPYRNSAMDGYGINIRAHNSCSLTENTPFNIIGEVCDQKESKIKIGKNEAIKVMTGSRLPPDVDSVIPGEEVEKTVSGIVIKNNVISGKHIRAKGEDFKKGEFAIPEGTRLNYLNIGILAYFRKIFFNVFQKPKIGILPTGNEIVDIDIYCRRGHSAGRKRRSVRRPLGRPVNPSTAPGKAAG